MVRKKNLFVNDKDKVPQPSTGEFTGFLNHSQYNQSWNHLRKPLLHLNGNGISPGDADTIPLESGFDQLQYGALDKQKKTGLKGQGLVVVLKGEMHIMYTYCLTKILPIIASALLSLFRNLCLYHHLNICSWENSGKISRRQYILWNRPL